ncbi:autotransporter strand-loop-strand O-heptosyltransferase [Gluconobacter cerinus]|uniref:autotransporter strand-loop-strand O-heptosyltransferase n=1 Tax=Gluconobacter TaxID=441 RepID=UPI0030B1DE1B
MSSPSMPPVQPASIVPTQDGPGGIRFDFNDGCRVLLPAGNWHVVLKDLDTHTVLFSEDVSQGIVQSIKRYYLRYQIEITKDGAPFFTYEMDLKDQPVLVRMREGGIGDHLAWFGQVAEFARKHECRLTCMVRPDIASLLIPVYPYIRLVSTEEEAGKDYYASYKVLIFYNDVARNHSPVDYREAGLENNAALILGLSRTSRPPDVDVMEGGRPLAERYVCIATQATSQNKYWNNPFGWVETIRFLKNHGYRVICIDRSRVNGVGTIWNNIPYGAEDFTGALPLAERARWLRHAEFFIGLSSGLSWLAWAVGTPIVLISGFTRPDNEFETPYRVINWNACNGCSNDIRCQLDPADYLWCPRQSGTDKQFECTRLISSQQVIDTIRKIPDFEGVSE